MADKLQIELTAESVRDAGERHLGKLLIGEVRLKCWPEGVAKTEPPLIDTTFTAQYKDVESLTIDEQLLRWGKEIFQKVDAVIERTLREQLLLQNQKFQDSITAIKTSLEAKYG